MLGDKNHHRQQVYYKQLCDLRQQKRNWFIFTIHQQPLECSTTPTILDGHDVPTVHPWLFDTLSKTSSNLFNKRFQNEHFRWNPIDVGFQKGLPIGDSQMNCISCIIPRALPLGRGISLRRQRARRRATAYALDDPSHFVCGWAINSILLSTYLM